ncbi:EFR1 family ferrodoxin [Caloramator sp. ALD01]|uniref:EFR1 family ferrodoxin n=1 Tax=Caloramator sp. ALD01 TaxID=1031288 RepID=UPI000402AD19|nr:EFR1 family ferrodoxin [Caloramator sp. ALD01]
MKGAIIYFSGTGNTEFVAKLFKKAFEEKGYEMDLIEVTKQIKFKDDYSILVFGSCIHSEVFPDVYMRWIDKNILNGNSRRCIVFSTQAAKSAAGANILSDTLKKRGFNVSIVEHIVMPNNFYVVAFGKDTKEEVKQKTKKAEELVYEIVDSFLKDIKKIKEVSEIRKRYGNLAYSFFKKYAKTWAMKKISVDYDLCVKCLKCVSNCPTKNINFKDEIEFQDKCICCQRCIHQCPVNAFKYKGKHFEQYKI